MDDKELQILEESYQSIVKTPAGRDLLTTLDEWIEMDLDKAIDDDDMTKKALYLQNVNAYRSIKTYLVNRSQVNSNP